jgi:hypothetical protein
MQSARAEVLVPPAALIFQERPIFSSGLYTGRSGFGIEGRGPSRPGQALSTALFGFMNLGQAKDPRAAGWTLGFRVGAAENHSMVGEYLSPASSTAEIAIGRASISPEFERNSGIRGFMELSYRIDQKLNSSLDSTALDAQVAEVLQKNTWIGIKSGASTDSHVKSSEEEFFSAKNFLFRSFLSIYIPIQGSKNTIFSGTVQTLLKCPGFDCGLVLGYDRVWGDANFNISESIKHSFNAGLRFERPLPSYDNRSFHLAVESVWGWVLGKNESLSSAWPGFKLQLSKSF